MTHDEEPARIPLHDIESRQDEVLRALETLEQRLTTLLAEYANSQEAKKAA